MELRFNGITDEYHRRIGMWFYLKINPSLDFAVLSDISFIQHIHKHPVNYKGILTNRIFIGFCVG
jgi:hypothetical protein